MGRVAAFVVLVVAAGVVGLLDRALTLSPVEKVERVVASMDAALAARDASAFVGFVHPLDPALIEEWRYWVNAADDPEVSSLSLRVLTLEQIREDEVVGALELGWTLRGEWVRQRIDARFAPVGSPSGGWAFAGRVWVVEESVAGLDVLADEVCAEHAAVVLERVPAMLERAVNELGVGGVGPMRVKLYASAAALQRSIDPTYTHPVSGWSEPEQSVKIHVSPGTHPDRLVEVLAHEIGHFVSFAHGASMRDAPWWVLEGAAELVSDPYKRVGVDRRQRAVALLVNNGDSYGWDALRMFDDETMTRALYVYTQGWSMVRYVFDTHGAGALGEWLGAMGRGSTLEEATRAALSMGFGELDAAWRASLAEALGSEP